MAVTITQLKNSKFLHKASHLYVTPWETITPGGGGATYMQPGNVTYDVVQVLADTVSIEQADPDTETRDWEFGDTPLMSTVTMGDTTFAATCIDLSTGVLENVFGWNTLSTTIVAAPDTYTDMYATITITFEDTNSPIIVLPKVLMSSKATIASLKTSTAEAALSGTCMSAYIGYATTTAPTGSGLLSTPYCFVNVVDGNQIYITDSTSNTAVSIGQVEDSPSTHLVNVA